MKKIFLLICVVSLFSCSNENNSGNDPGSNTINFPQANGNYWKYSVQTNDLPLVSDSLYINGEIQANGFTYKKYNVNDMEIASGFYTGTLNNNGIRVANNQYLLNGTLGVGSGLQLPINLSFNLSDFVIFDSGASTGITVDEIIGSQNQTVSGLSLNITYTLKSIAGENIANYTSPNGTVYQNVRSHKIVVDLNITTPLGSLPISIINQPNAIESTQYYADNIGMVYSTMSFNASVNPLAVSVLPNDFPATINFTQNETLVDYSVN